MVRERFAELVGMLMIGDGVLAVLEPSRHARLWREGPATWEWMVDPFVKRPGLTRWLGAVEVAAGIWLASRQTPSWEDRDHSLAVPEHVPKTFAESF